MWAYQKVDLLIFMLALSSLYLDTFDAFFQLSIPHAVVVQASAAVMMQLRTNLDRHLHKASDSPIST